VIRLTCFVPRKPGMSPEDFHQHWREVHGPLVRSTNSGSHVVRYEQHHRPLSDYGNTIVSDYDGVTVQWFRSMDDFWASVSEPDYADINDDIERFIDSSRLVWLLTEEPEVVIEGPLS
jgi:uncharacterized protein (TIGR02118 family)